MDSRGRRADRRRTDARHPNFGRAYRQVAADGAWRSSGVPGRRRRRNRDRAQSCPHDMGKVIGKKCRTCARLALPGECHRHQALRAGDSAESRELITRPVSWTQGAPRGSLRGRQTPTDRFRQGMKLWARGGAWLPRGAAIEELWPHKGSLVLSLWVVIRSRMRKLCCVCELQVPAMRGRSWSRVESHVSDLIGCTNFSMAIASLVPFRMCSSEPGSSAAVSENLRGNSLSSH